MKMLSFGKVLGERNCADLFMKETGMEPMERYMKELGVRCIGTDSDSGSMSSLGHARVPIRRRSTFRWGLLG